MGVSVCVYVFMEGWRKGRGRERNAGIISCSSGGPEVPRSPVASWKTKKASGVVQSGSREHRNQKL